MAEASSVKVLNHCRVAPPPFSVPSTSLPLTFFDIPWLRCIPMERLFFYEYPYPSHHFIQTILPTLTHSLSLSLQHFFPFAGNLICPPRPRKPHIVYVDGDSVALTVSASTADFNHLTADHPRDVKDLHPLTPKLPPPRVLEDGSLVFPLMAIQATVFPGSGFSIGVIFHHTAADGRSFHHFMKSWASICRNRGTCLEKSEPFHNRDEIKDPNELELKFLNDWWNYFAHKYKEDIDLIHYNFTDKVRATIILSRAQIQKLKHWVSVQYRDELATTHLSTFVATCSLIWVCLLQSEESVIGFSGDDDKLCYFIFSADCRNRYELSIPSTYFGNCLAFCYVPLKRKELVGEFGFLNAVKAIGNKVKELERGALKGAEKWMELSKEIAEGGHHVVIVAASPKFNVYQTDFGWGKPKKSEVVHTDKLGVISLADGREEEGGVEVGLAIPEAQMNKFNGILKKCLEIM